MDDRRLYETILGLSEPWSVASVEVSTESERIEVRLDLSPDVRLLCPVCGEAAPGYDRSVERRWRHLDTCQYQTILVARVPRVECAEHGVRQIAVPWAEEKSRFTALFEALAIRLLRETTVAGLASIMGLSWDEASGIQRRAVARGLARRAAKPLTVVGVDETSFAKRHEYVTVVADLERSCVTWVGDHRRRHTLTEFWATIPATERDRIEAAVMDMWEPYITATAAALPGGAEKIVFDRFHVMQQLHQAVDQVRRAEHRELRAQGDTRLTGTRYLWLKGVVRRTPGDRVAIDALRKAGLKVGRAWAIKEAIGTLWDYRSAAWARKYFHRWYYWATHSQLPPIIRAAKTLKRYLAGILAYLKHPYTNALTESLNAKIQLLKYRARGYRNRANFALAILFHCGKLDMDPR